MSHRCGTERTNRGVLTTECFRCASSYASVVSAFFAFLSAVYWFIGGKTYTGPLGVEVEDEKRLHESIREKVTRE